MARITIYPGKEFLRRIEQMQGSLDQAIPKALEVGGKVAYKIMRSNLSRVAGKGTKYPSRSSGKLKASLGVSPVKLNDSGTFDVKVGFSDGRGKVSNAMLANILEYGKHGQPAKPFLAPTKARAEQPCLAAMEAELKRGLEIK